MSKIDDDYNAMLYIHEFVSENMKSGGLTPETAERIKTLWNQYKQPTVENDCSIITCDFGRLGSVVIRDVEFSPNRETLSYKTGSYDMISITSNLTRRILWTDYKNIEPYNRQCGLYCDGASFKMLGPPVLETPEYREFVHDSKYTSNISFSVWGFNYNNYYGSVTFGMSIKKNQVDTFLSELRKLINK